MPQKIYILTWTPESGNLDPAEISHQPQYYQYAEDANYKAGEVLKQLVTEEVVDEYGVWENIDKCGGTPFVQTIPYQHPGGEVDYTVMVREERLYDDLQDVVPVPPLDIGSGPRATFADLSGDGTQRPISNPAFRTFSPREMPLRDLNAGAAIGFNSQPALSTSPPSNAADKEPNLGRSTTPDDTLRPIVDWLLCQPTCSPSPQPLPPASTSDPSRSELSSSDFPYSETSLSSKLSWDPTPLLFNEAGFYSATPHPLASTANTSFENFCFSCLVYVHFIYFPPDMFNKNSKTLIKVTASMQKHGCTPTRAVAPASPHPLP